MGITLPLLGVAGWKAFKNAQHAPCILPGGKGFRGMGSAAARCARRGVPTMVAAINEGSVDGPTGGEGSVDGGTIISTLDGRDEEGISLDCTVPPGEDLVERDLRRVFDLDADGDSLYE